MQIAASSKFKSELIKEQQNLIKEQLSHNNSLPKIRRRTPKKSKNAGPLKVYSVQSHVETIRSETSISRKSSIIEEVVSRDGNTNTAITISSGSVNTENKENRKPGISSVDYVQSESAKR